MTKQSIGIIGYGRFGQLLHTILAADFEVFFYDPNKVLQHHARFRSLDDILLMPTIYLCMPINRLESFLNEHAARIKAETVIDVCSVKVYPVRLMLQYLRDDINIIASHPMFGPDSYHRESVNNMMMYPVRIGQADFELWQDYFSSKNMNVKIITPEQHDMESAYSQNITHVIGRTLGELDLQDCDIATKGYASLLTIISQTCNDSWELFQDMLQFNPYSQAMLDKLQHALNAIVNKQHTTNDKVLTNGE